MIFFEAEEVEDEHTGCIPLSAKKERIWARRVRWLVEARELL